MTQWLCKLTGGHRYSADNLETTYDAQKMVHRFRHTCTRCGAVKQVVIPSRCFFPTSNGGAARIAEED